MDTQNHFYSHAAVLAAYCGLSRPRHIRGLLQHGWTTISPVAANFGDFPWVDGTGKRRLLVWSHESRAWSPSEEKAQTTPIGAPWAYLARLVGEVRRQEPGQTVVLPVHGTRVIRWQGDHSALAAEVREREGAVQVSVHHEDLDDPVLVNSWLAHGHTLVSSGARQDVDFLPRQMALLGRARRVVSNRLSTAVLYAAALGVPVAVYGDPFAASGDDQRAYQRIREAWPEFHGEEPDSTATTETARRELGWGSVRPPAELRELLGWRHPFSTLAAADYWTRGPLEKGLRVVGLRERVGGGPALESGVNPRAWLRHPLEHLPSRISPRLPSVDPLPDPMTPRLGAAVLGPEDATQEKQAGERSS